MQFKMVIRLLGGLSLFTPFMLQAILVRGESWQLMGDGHKSASGLASNQGGEVFFSDAPDHTIYHRASACQRGISLLHPHPI
jgi:hypothetical protein